MARAGVSVSWIEGVIASKRKGITVANAFMTDGRVVRFGIVARDPLTLRTLSSAARPGDVEAIESWFAEQSRAAD
jgi:hypothetical protein